MVAPSRLYEYLIARCYESYAKLLLFYCYFLSMQRKIYLGGLPWELDRIGVLNYFKAVMEGENIIISYEPHFVTPHQENANAAVKLTDVFVAMDQQTGKSRGFGFITLEFAEDDSLFDKIVSLLAGKVLIGIRGARELIANEATPKEGPDAANAA